ncbi:rRNA biogenesis protein rrp36-like [Phragmites australis]|uniref:rRNA biogenesis protein rrp36-like n=1 Tax=Phragmites australis TaxID=29695 RepID=UPI002D77E89D|nr:rRNA biogenesis protein rrp36-like [Phragmites australis]
MAANDKDLASSSLMPAPDDDYIDSDLFMVEAEEEYEMEKAITNDEKIARAVHEEELISQAKGTTEAIAHLLAEEVEMGSDSDTNDGEEGEDEEMGGDSDTNDDDEEEDEDMGGIQLLDGNIEDSALSNIRARIASFLMTEVVSSKGEDGC